MFKNQDLPQVLLAINARLREEISRCNHWPFEIASAKLLPLPLKSSCSQFSG
jgi:hypothetical protein